MRCITASFAFLRRQGSRAAREAHLAIRFAAVSLLPTNRHKPRELSQPISRGKGAPTIPVWAVVAQEQDAPPGVKPLEWLLLTTLSVTSFEQATEKLIWYARHAPSIRRE